MRRFKPTGVGFAYILLAFALGGAAAGLVFALTGSDSSSSQSATATPGSSKGTWSTWHPAAIGSSAVREIASHVAGEYRLPSGKQLVNVIAHEPAIAQGLNTFRISAIEVKSDTSEKGARVFPVGNGVMFILCGSGPDCSIADGKPSAARGVLVRREALELALDTFKYVDGIDSVMAFVPPVPGSQEKQFIVLRRGEVAGNLAQPLANTIGNVRTVKTGDVTSKESAGVDGLALPHLYVLSQTQQLPDSTLALLLTPQSLPTL